VLVGPVIAGFFFFFCQQGDQRQLALRRLRIVRRRRQEGRARLRASAGGGAARQRGRLDDSPEKARVLPGLRAAAAEVKAGNGSNARDADHDPAR